MTKKAPPIPREQRSGGERRANLGEHQERRDAKTGLQSGQPGDADANLDTQGRFGNIRQNLTPQRSVQDR